MYGHGHKTNVWAWAQMYGHKTNVWYKTYLKISSTITLTMDTIFNVMHPYFTQHRWRLSATTPASLCYKNSHPYDDIIITMPSNNIINVTVPVGKNPYRKTFKNIDIAIEYVKMHLDYYTLTHAQ